MSIVVVRCDSHGEVLCLRVIASGGTQQWLHQVSSLKSNQFIILLILVMLVSINSSGEYDLSEHG